MGRRSDSLQVESAVKHMGIATVRGKFPAFEGTLAVADELRYAHLRSPDFFDAAAYPEIAFESTRIEAIDADRRRSSAS